ncbi:sigma factor-like helix-turn-helix DNA-binding protein [Streptomyces sp. NPDC056242]|uniref:sigma factor-like helix-turn-helix DNA-binding protein n=1 Tax=Streptomyces sp. NPDC056242 TaxID=3345760 RepID=UPI0035D80E79
MKSMRAARSGWPASRWTWGVGERADEIGGVVVGEGLGEAGQRLLGPDRKVVEGGDLPGKLAQMGGVGPGPGRDGAAGCAAAAGGLYALFTGGAGSSGPYAQVAPLRGLARCRPPSPSRGQLEQDAPGEFFARRIGCHAQHGADVPGLLPCEDAFLIDGLGVTEGAYDVVTDREAAKAGLGHLSDRERAILYMRFFEDMTQSRIAEKFGISQVHVSRIIRESCRRVRDATCDWGRFEKTRAA